MNFAKPDILRSARGSARLLILNHFLFKNINHSSVILSFLNFTNEPNKFYDFRVQTMFELRSQDIYFAFIAAFDHLLSCVGK